MLPVRMVLIATLALSSSCSGDDADPAVVPADRDVPESFLFGAATAGFQVDMGCPTTDCTDAASDWYAWVTDPGIIATSSLFVTGESLDVSPGMWELFESDVARMKADGMTGYRMSLEWSRLFPDGAAEQASTVDDLAAHANPAAVARYHEMFQALRAAGIEPLVTVNHYTLPTWVHDGVACHADPDACTADGWVTAERIVPLIALYTGFVAREYAGEVDTWITLNEPYATTISGYLQPGEARSAPPGLSLDFARAVAVAKHQIEGHAAMTDALRAEDTVDASGDGTAVSVGLVMNMAVFEPTDPERPQDVLAAEHADYLYHQLYFDAVTTGAWDEDVDGVVDTTRADLAGRLDFIGVNYYNRVFVSGLGITLSEDLPLFDFIPTFSWDPYPEGLGIVVRRAADWNLPIIVTENGTPYVEERGAEVLDGHLASLRDAMRDGADVRGYMYWSYVDNYEWNHGMDLRFGLYTFDPVTKERQERAVMERFREVMATGQLVAR
jgi:beta-galactosidase